MSHDDLSWEISVQEVQRMREAGEDFVLLDVREPAEVAIARIEGSLHVPVGDIPFALPHLSAHADRRVVTICHKGVRSLSAASFLRQQGFADVRSMAGGIEAWSQMIDPQVPRY